LQKALAGDAAAVDALVRRLGPVIQARVARSLLRWRTGSAAGRNVRQEVEDLVQEIFVVLFSDGGKILRGWEPERGLSLENFVGLVAERRTASLMASGRRSPWKESPTEPPELDGPREGPGPERTTAARQELRLLLNTLRAELSPLGRRLFELIYLRRLSVEEVMEATDLSADAVYAWRSRLRKLARKLRPDLSSSGP
jgi:RNA polymerase sigma-70 factor (ECF subfamily)